jgi:hypothetical protein
MAKKNNSGSKGTLRRTGKHVSAVSDATYRQKKRPDIEAIWDACRKAQDADASRKARDAARARAAALALGRFKQNESGRWAYQCPDCQQTVDLGITVNGDVRASSSGTKTCSTVPRIQQWLCDKGFQS